MKRLPSPAPGGLKVSKLAKSTIRPISGAATATRTATATTAGSAAFRASALAADRERRRTFIAISTTAQRPAAPASQRSPGKL